MAIAIPISTPIVNAGIMYVNGLALTYVDTTHITVSAGAARNQSDVNLTSANSNFTNEADIVLPVSLYPNAATAPVTINTAQQGAAGLDVGTIAINTLYAVYVIGDSYGINPTSALLSLSFDAPSLPAAQQGGYDMYRRIGAVLTDGSAHILPFWQAYTGNGSGRTMYYDTGIEILTAGTSDTYAAVNCAADVPSTGATILFQVQLTPTAAGNTVNLRPTGDNSTEGLAIMSGDVAAVVHSDVIACPSSALASVDYKVTGSVNLFIKGYVDAL